MHACMKDLYTVAFYSIIYICTFVAESVNRSTIAVKMLHFHSCTCTSISCSVSSVNKGNNQSVDQSRDHKLRRRSSSLTDLAESSTSPARALAPLTTLEQTKGREREEDGKGTSSSPDLNVIDLPPQGESSTNVRDDSIHNEKEGGGWGEDESEREQERSSKGEKTGVLMESVSDSLNTDRMSISTTGSAMSGVSGDDVETVVDEDEKATPQGGRRSEGRLHSSDLDLEGDQESESTKVEGSVEREQLSASCSTLENEKQELDRESSIEPPRRHFISVSFRQELLNVCQLKTEPKVDGEVAKLASPSMDVVQMLGRTLPHIVPHMIHNKREVRNYM